MLYIVDTYAWIAYFAGTDKGKKVQKLLMNEKHSFITLESSIGELFSWSSSNNLLFGEFLKVVRINSDITPVLLNNWVVAARIRHEKRKTIKDFGIMDALLISKQQELNCKIITGDKHFKSLKSVDYLG